MSVLDRTTFKTSRLLDFCSEKELVAQTGHSKDDWPLVIMKELVDNALDACEESGTAPCITVKVDESGIEVTDNGPGIPPDTVAGVLDFSVRVSSREAYVSPTRGAQGNALKTLVAMPFVLNGERGEVEIEARGIRHRIAMSVDRIRQEPVIAHDQEPCDRTGGTSVLVRWPDSPCSIQNARLRFLQIASDYTFLNPHLTLSVAWADDSATVPATKTEWDHWLPNYPTSPWWYDAERLGRLVAGYLAHDADAGRSRTMREFVSEFRGLSGSAKQKAVLDDAKMNRAPALRAFRPR